MKRIILKRLSLVNFKGIRSLDVSFNELGPTTVRGRNHSGKTTLFDAFTWLLFGKDSQDRKQFALRTFDENGSIIPKIPHEVMCELWINGEKVILRRRFVEKWTKKRGALYEEYIGNEEERYYNEVPCKKSEFDEKIAAIIPEQVFKFVTNPNYFCSQKPDVQRAMLFRMAGDVSNEDIAKGNIEFEQLLNCLVGKTLEEYKREISAKKKAIKDDIRDIPSRIDEIERSKPATEDWGGLESEIAGKRERIAEIESLISDKSNVFKAAVEKRMESIRAIQTLRDQLMQRESALRSFASNVQIGIDNKRSKFEADKARLVVEESHTKAMIDVVVSNIADATRKRGELLAEWKEINARSLEFNDNDFVCPTCRRPFEESDAERMREEMTANFNKKRAADLEENARKGRQIRNTIDELTARKAELDEKLKGLQVTIEELKEPVVENPLPEGFFEKDSQRLALMAKIEELEKMAPERTDGTSDAEIESLRQEKNRIQDEIVSLSTRIHARETINKLDERKIELGTQMREKTAELARLEKIEFVMQQFSRARIEAVEGRINSMFSIVRFKMFETQINGAEVETCECMLHNTPYSVLSLSERVNAGIDIINAICKSEQIYAPIIIDNRESISDIIDTDSQIVNLVVDENCPTLTIK